MQTHIKLFLIMYVANANTTRVEMSNVLDKWP